MAGNRKGGLKAAATNKANNPDFYKIIGAAGGRISRGGVFSRDYVNADGMTGPELAAKYGSIGGSRSSRRKTE